MIQDSNNTVSKLEKILDLVLGIANEDSKTRSPWLTTSEAAIYLRCSTRQVERLSNQGAIPFVRQNPAVWRSPRLYYKKQLDAYLITGKNLQSARLTASERKDIENLLG